MNKVLLASLIAIATTSSFAETVRGGNVTIDGQITAGACAISSEDANKVVTLDTIPANKFTAAQQEANVKKRFELTLVDCDTSGSSTVGVAFSGMSDTAAAGALANTAGAGAAQNVAIQLYSEDGSKLALGTETSYELNQTVPMVFAADYVSTAAEVTAGKVTAVANFDLTYQ